MRSEARRSSFRAGRSPWQSSFRWGRRRRLGGLRELMSDRELAALVAAIESPLTPRDQDAVEGNETDLVGINRR